MKSSPPGAGLWELANALPRPVNYWKGRLVHETFCPDNILLFPWGNRPVPAGKTYGSYHPRFVLDLLLEGNLTLHLGGRDFALGPGEGILIFPHQLHYARSGREEAKAVAVTFELHGKETLEPLRDAPRRLRSREWTLLAEVISLYREGSGLELAHRLARLLLSLVEAPEIPQERRNLPSPEPERDAFLDAVNACLEGASPSLPALARAAGCTEGQLKNLFRKHLGTTPADYIRRNRLSKAARRLQQGEGNVTEIAAELGFSSVYAFSRMFKAAYGLPPKQYEKLARGPSPAQ